MSPVEVEVMEDAPASIPAQPAAGAPAEVAPVLYDADAEQTIKVTVERTIQGERRRYEVFHRLAACSDDLFVEHDKARKVRYRYHPDKSIETVQDQKGAARFLYDTLKREVTGWGPTDGSKVDDDQASMVVYQGLLLSVAEQAEEAAGIRNAEEDKPWEVAATSRGLKLRARFNGAELVMTHYPTSVPTADQVQRYESLQARKKIKAGARLAQMDFAAQSSVRPLGKLYDELFGPAEGYAGRVPLWHKVEVVTAYLEEDSEAVGED